MNETSNVFRVFVDSNILISAMQSETSISRRLLEFVSEHHRLLICTYSLTEVSEVVNRKYPDLNLLWDEMLSKLDFELIYTPLNLNSVKVPFIRDVKDISVLVSAKIAEPDILVTGDRDFQTSEIREYFTVYTPVEFLRYFG